MKENKPASPGHLGGRKPKQASISKNKGFNRSASPGKKTPEKSTWNKGKPAFGERKSAQGKGGFSAFRKDGEKRSEPNFEKRYGRPGFRDVYQPRQAQGSRQQSDYQSPASKRFGPASKQVFNPSWVKKPVPPVSSEALIPNNVTSYVQDEAIEADINLLTGRNPIREALKTGRDLEKLMVAKGDLSGSARQIVSMAKNAGVMVQFVERKRLDQVARNHQGMVAYVSAYQYSALEDILNVAKEKNEAPFIVLLDQLTDPHNLGAIIRTAACAGAHGVIVPMHRAVGLTPAAVKASAGAVEHIKVARVTNLNKAIEKLKSLGIWIYAADQSGDDYRKETITGPCALVIGSEGEGISAHTLSLCDYRIKIPMVDTVGSLNASVAAGILMYAVYHGRNPVIR
ncbi:MAG: 23S rRNA (guanosine(2251)-2'-O)-methyltransferase RlmB [Christensenellales bacterium]